MTIVFYDNTGYVYFYMTGDYRVPQGGIQYLEIENILEGQRITGVDMSVTPNIPTYGDITTV